MGDLIKAQFIDACKSLGLEVSKSQWEQFHIYYELLVETNKVMNLTAITDYKEVVLKHFIDSISIVDVMDMSKIKSIIDVGTGAGFPGVPLKIMFPEKEFLLLDSLNKRLNFVDNVIDRLKLMNIVTVHGRSEELAHNPRYREHFDLAVSRAVANMNTLAEYCLPFVKLGGTFVAYKSATSAPELEAASEPIKKLGGSDISLDRMTLPASDIERIFAIVKKERNTPKGFPRKAGVPSKTPLQ